MPDRAWAEGCEWPVAFEIPVGEDWPSGFYEIEFSDRQDRGESGRSHAFFVVRDRESERENAVLVLSTSTYAAYNYWGGGCLYTGEVRVSFDRPLERGYLRRPAAPFETDFDGRAANTAVPSDPTHRRLLYYQARNHYPLWTNSAGWHNWERRFVRWTEAEGWRFGFATSQDLHHDASLLSGRELMITVGHDEYWSWEMRDAVERFVRAGGNLLALSGNTAAWQVRFEGNAMVCHKSAVDDPLSGTDQDHLVTTMWADPILGRPETQLHGLTFTRGGYHRMGHAVADGRGGYEVHRPEHWAFEALDLERGDLVGSQDFCVGYEVDGCALEFAGDLPFATGEDGAPASIEILATAPARLMSITDSVCEAPAGLWASMDPPAISSR